MLQIETQGPVLRLSLDRPEVRNALNAELIQKLTEAIQSIGPEIRAIVLSGNGPAFCAGGDLEWMRQAAGYSEEENVRDAMKLSRLFRSIHESRAVTITVVQGACYGGACGLVSSSDITLAADDSTFAFSEVKLGLIPATIAPFVLERLGKGASKALFVTGEAFGAAQALRIGLVHEVAPRDELETLLSRKLKSILSAGPEAIRLSKKLVTDEDLTHDECAKRLARVRASREGKEGVVAFLEKRKASFVTEWPK